MSDIPKLMLEIVKMSPRYIIAISVAIIISSLVVILSQTNIGVDPKWINLSFVLSVSSLVLFTLDRVRIWCIGLVKDSSSNRKTIKCLTSLSEKEKQILRIFIKRDIMSHILPSSDAAVQNLISNNVLVPSNGGTKYGWNYWISKKAFDYIRSNPVLLKGDTDKEYVDEVARCMHIQELYSNK